MKRVLTSLLLTICFCGVAFAQDDDKTAEKPAEPPKTIDHNAQAPSAARSDVGSKAV